MSVVEYREEWLAARKRGIGGTDIGAILNLSPWKNPLDVYLGKLGLSQWQEPTEAMWWGTQLEALIAGRYGQRMNCEVVRGADIAGLFESSRSADWNGQTIIEHAAHPFILGTPDGIVPMLERGLEIKNVSFQSHEWGREFTDEIPLHYRLQVAWYMAITELPQWDLAALFSGNRLHVYTIARDLELESMLIDAGCEFWQKHVLAEVPPPIDASETWARHLGRKFATGSERVLDATVEAETWARALREAQAAKAAAEEKEGLAKNHLMQIVGDAKGMKAAWGRVTWVRPRPSQVTDWEAVAKELNPSAELIAEHTGEKARTAYLKTTFAGQKEE